MPYQYTNQKQIRDSFKQCFPELIIKKTHNECNATTRSAFCDYVDFLRKDGLISEALAYRTTLG